MPLPAAAHLVEFPLASKADREGEDRSGALALMSETEIAPDAEPVDAAYVRGREEGLAAAQAEYAAILEEERAAAETRLAEARAVWSSEEGDRLGDLIGTAFKALEANIGDAVAAILSPLLEETLRKRAVEELSQALMPLLAGGRQTLRVSGPADLLEALRQELGEGASSIEFESADAVDVRVVADQTTIETQLAAWMPRIYGQSA